MKIQRPLPQVMERGRVSIQLQGVQESNQVRAFGRGFANPEAVL
jgi:hypothetical protein